MAAGKVSPVTVLRDACSFDKLGSALLKTRLMDDADVTRTPKTLY
jgi:hypothetical protein